MATYNSTQLDIVADNATSTAPTKQIPASQYRSASLNDLFNWNTDDTSTTLAHGDLIRLVKVPAKSTVKQIRCIFEAMGSDQEAEIGLEAVDGTGYIDAAGTVADDTDFFNTASIDVSASGEITVGILQEDNPLYVTEKEVYLTLLVSRGAGTSTWAADKDFSGYIEYLDVTG